jgi:hypothetical protein
MHHLILRIFKKMQEISTKDFNDRGNETPYLILNVDMIYTSQNMFYVCFRTKHMPIHA